MELFFDTETSDKFNFKIQHYYDENFPWPVQIGVVLAEEGIAYAELNLIVKPEGRIISEGAYKVHQIDTKLAERVGVFEADLLVTFMRLVKNADILVAHNYQFDSQIMAGSLFRCNYKKGAESLISNTPYFCTMKDSTNLCKLPGNYGSYKWPKLSELHQFLFNEGFMGAHDAMYDIRATMKCYYELKKRKENK